MGQRILDRKDFPRLLGALVSRGYKCVGPAVREGAIVYDEIDSVEDLPIGWGDEQDAARYRLVKKGGESLFGYVVGPHSWKKFLFPSELLLWQAKRQGKALEILEPPPDEAMHAFIGVRSCEIHAIALQDKVFMDVDPVYRARRNRLFIVAVNCAVAGGTCFCVSMKTGPKAQSGFDLALTEVIRDGVHQFVVEIGSEKGAQALQDVPHRDATGEESNEAVKISERTESQMGRKLDTAGIKELLYRNYDNARWDDAARRCLSCANCTMACPTCFCSTVEDVSDLTGEHAERWRKWDSCFTADFSHLHGGSVRSSTKSRYRQWMTHKLATWIDQFGSSGCVGCGRCITWCPVGIDITEEAAAIRDSDGGAKR